MAQQCYITLRKPGHGVIAAPSNLESDESDEELTGTPSLEMNAHLEVSLAKTYYMCYSFLFFSGQDRYRSRDAKYLATEDRLS